MKFIKKTILFSVLIIAISNNIVFAESTIIQPFGGLNWNDSFFDVIKKVNKIEGVKKVYIDFDDGTDDEYESHIGNVNYNAYAGSVDITNVTSDIIIKNKFVELEKQLQNPNIIEYINRQGKILKYPKLSLNIHAEPFIIEGIPYRLIVCFKQEPGLALERNQYVINDNPIYFDQVKLILNGSDLKIKYPQNQCEKIRTILENKYKIMFIPDWGRNRPKTYDMNGSSNTNIHIIDDVCYNIIYSNLALSLHYSQFYEKFLTNFEANKSKNFIKNLKNNQSGKL